MPLRSRLAVLGLPIILMAACSLFHENPTPPTDDPPADRSPVPIVAIRGGPLGEFEEALPAGAKIRIGSTRFRFPFDPSELKSKRAGRFVLVSRNGQTYISDSETGRRLNAGRPIFDSGQFSVSPDGKWIATPGDHSHGKSIEQLWAVTDDPQSPLRISGCFPTPVTAIDFYRFRFFSNDSQSLIVCSDEFINIYDVRTSQRKSTVESKDHIFRISQDGKRFLASPAGDPEIGFLSGGGLFYDRGYGFRKPAEVQTYWPRDRIERLLNPSIPTNVRNYRVEVRDCATGEPIASLDILRDGSPRVDFELSPDGRYLSHDFFQSAIVWDVDQRRPILNIRPGLSWKTLLHFSVQQMWFSKDGRYFSVRISNDSERHFELPNGREVTAEVAQSPRPTTEYYKPPTRPITSVGTILPKMGSAIPPGYSGILLDVAPNGQRFAIGDAQGRVDMWRLTGAFERRLSLGKDAITAIAFSEDGEWIATCDRKRTLAIWEVRSGRELMRIPIPADHDELWPTSLTFSPDRSRLVLAQDAIIAMLDIRSKEIIWENGGSMILQCAYSNPRFSKDGRHVLHYPADTWLDAGTGKRIKPVRLDVAEEGLYVRFHKSHVDSQGESATLSPDGRTLAIADRDDMLRVRNLGDDSSIAFLESKLHTRQAGSLRFSPDGRRLLTFNDRGQLHVWEIASGQLAFVLDYPNGHFTDARFGIDGRTIITANHREVIVWDLLPTKKVEDPWDALQHDAPIAEQARRTFLLDPKGAIAFIEKRLRSAPALDDQRIASLIATLEDKDFRTRERSAAGLIEYGRPVLPRLKEAKLQSEEGKARLASLVRLLSGGPISHELRRLRAAEILEQARASLR